MSIFRDTDSCINLAEALNLGVDYGAPELELINVPNVGILDHCPGLKDVVVADFHLPLDRLSLLILPDEIENLAFLFDDAVVAEHDVASFSDYSALRVHYASVPEDYAALQFSLVRHEDCWLNGCAP